MDINFYSAHIETLCDLQKIAKNYNCKISFGTRSCNDKEDIDISSLKHYNISNEVIDILTNGEYCVPGKIDNTFDTYWFELSENKGEKYHTLSYIKFNCSFVIDSDEYDELSDKIKEELDDYKCDWYDSFNNGEYMFIFEGGYTKVFGFGNTETVKDHRVYREGMALKYFADEVCDYFKEDRINRVY